DRERPGFGLVEVRVASDAAAVGRREEGMRQDTARAVEGAGGGRATWIAMRAGFEANDDVGLGNRADFGDDERRDRHPGVECLADRRALSLLAEVGRILLESVGEIRLRPLVAGDIG